MGKCAPVRQRGETSPELLPFCEDEVRLTSLLGGNGGAVGLGRKSIGAAEPLEKVTDVVSAMRLDLGLLLWDGGRMDKRLIHEPLDKTESRGPAEGTEGENSPGLAKDSLLLENLGDVICELGGRWWRDKGGLEGVCECETVRWCECSSTIEGAADVVSGRAWTIVVGRKLTPNTRSTDMVLWCDLRRVFAGLSSVVAFVEVLVVGEGGGGWPKTKPLAAAAMAAPVPTSCGETTGSKHKAHG